MTTFFVHGLPTPQGSSRAFVVNGKAVITSANRNLKAWRDLVSLRAQEFAEYHEGAVVVHLEFYLPRPISLPKKVQHHVKKPDLDKVVRAVNDSLTGIMFKDDSQIISIIATKEYATSEQGVRITVLDA